MITARPARGAGPAGAGACAPIAGSPATRMRDRHSWPATSRGADSRSTLRAATRSWRVACPCCRFVFPCCRFVFPCAPAVLPLARRAPPTRRHAPPVRCADTLLQRADTLLQPGDALVQPHDALFYLRNALSQPCDACFHSGKALVEEDLVLVEHAESTKNGDNGDSDAPFQNSDLAREDALLPGLFQVAGAEGGGCGLIHRSVHGGRHGST